jgi:16S rRNA (cytosine967-C5)-methyltransferase
VASGNSGVIMRAEAARAVHAVRVNGRSLDDALAKSKVAPEEQALLQHLCYETLRHHWQLRGQIALLLARPLARRDAVIEDLLAVGLAQLQYSRIAPHAVVSQTVEAVRLLRLPKFSGLVNAVLRRYQREQPVAEDLEASHNHPDWILQRLQRDWPDDWQAIVAANNERAPMWLRVNRTKSSVMDYKAANAIDARDGAALGLDAALCLAEPQPVESLAGFAEGAVSVQDGAAQLAAPWLLADGGERILDACAAPGGKTAHLLELAGPAVALSAIDNDADRLQRVADTVLRTGGHATLLHADASKPEEWWDGTPFDRILLDAPCSASGVIRRHPDIRLLRRDSDIAALARRQLQMLKALWPLLSAGGRLLYVTCSVFAEENDAVVRAFLDEQADAQEEALLPNNNIRALMSRKAAGWQILPGTQSLDGFYYACLCKQPV